MSARRHRRSVRLRLTLLYGGLFALASAGLICVTYVLVDRATDDVSTVTMPDGGIVTINGDPPEAASGAAPSRTQADADPGQETAAEPGAAGGVVVGQAPTDEQIELARRLAKDEHARQMRDLLLQSGIALAAMTLLSVGLGWFVAGRVLRPLRAITSTARSISTSNLDQRLALEGPHDELKELADTFDDLLARLQAAFDAQRHFVANASHELRTPLTVMRALLQMTLRDPDASVATFRATCEEVMAAGEEQERLIEALLVLARSERGLDQRSPVDVAAVAERVLAGRVPPIAAAGLVVHRSLGASAVTEGDDRLIERLVANLLDNATRHNVEGGWIEVTVDAVGGRARLLVANSGPVVPADQVGGLFEPFRRHGGGAPPPTSRVALPGQGLGLGLAIVRAIAEAHDATVAATARPEGGLCVDVSFPASTGVPLRSAEDASGSSPSSAGPSDRGAPPPASRARVSGSSPR